MIMNQSIHVGELIQKKFEELHPDKTQMWLAEQLGRSDRTVRNYFKRQSMRIKDIKKLSVAIGYNFLADLHPDNFEEVDQLTLTEIETYLAAQISKAYDNYKQEHPECTKKWLADKLCVGERTAKRLFHSAPVDDAFLFKLSNLLGTNLFLPVAGILQRHFDEVKAGRAGLLLCINLNADTFPSFGSNSNSFTLSSEDKSRSQAFDVRKFSFMARAMEWELRKKD